MMAIMYNAKLMGRETRTKKNVKELMPSDYAILYKNSTSFPVPIQREVSLIMIPQRSTLSTDCSHVLHTWYLFRSGQYPGA